jgi:hypothetical protein
METVPTTTEPIKVTTYMVESPKECSGDSNDGAAPLEVELILETEEEPDLEDSELPVVVELESSLLLVAVDLPDWLSEYVLLADIDLRTAEHEDSAEAETTVAEPLKSQADWCLFSAM